MGVMRRPHRTQQHAVSKVCGDSHARPELHVYSTPTAGTIGIAGTEKKNWRCPTLLRSHACVWSRCPLRVRACVRACVRA